jgi:hypothetical protein
MIHLNWALVTEQERLDMNRRKKASKRQKRKVGDGKVKEDLRIGGQHRRRIQRRYQDHRQDIARMVEEEEAGPSS